MRTEYYEMLAKRSLNTSLLDQHQLLNAALGLAGESGEVADHVKKYLFHDHPLDREKLILELGDLQWYIMQACYALNTNIEAVMSANITKLEARYPNGFSSQASLDRKDLTNG